jgi:hypothetical protein
MDLSVISRIYDNVLERSIHTHEIACGPAANLISTSLELFRVLDKSDPIHSDFALRLWVLRSTVSFTLLPFNDAALNLREAMNGLLAASFRIPEAVPFMTPIQQAVEGLLELKLNPKLKCASILSELEAAEGGRRAGLLCALSLGEAPGWPRASLSDVALQVQNVKLLRRKRDLSSEVFSRIILPCACRNAPMHLLSDIFHSGRAARIDALLYPGERLRTPERLLLPQSPMFRHEAGSVVVAHVPDRVSIDAWADENFWQRVHGAARTSARNHVRAHYALFCDGTGAFFPADGRALVVPEGGTLSDENDLALVRVEEISEGDLVVLRSGRAGVLLDITSARIMGGETEEDLPAEATDWKSALEALLLTYREEDIAQELRARGAHASATSVRQWAGVETLGPGDEQVFGVLIALLHEKGKIAASTDYAAYADHTWKKLTELRSIRQRAGTSIRKALMEALREKLAGCNSQLGDKTSVNIDDGSEAELVILRISAFDHSVSFVQPSRLYHLEDHWGNKWLG